MCYSETWYGKIWYNTFEIIICILLSSKYLNKVILHFMVLWINKISLNISSRVNSNLPGSSCARRKPTNRKHLCTWNVCYLFVTWKYPPIKVVLLNRTRHTAANRLQFGKSKFLQLISVNFTCKVLSYNDQAPPPITYHLPNKIRHQEEIDQFIAHVVYSNHLIRPHQTVCHRNIQFGLQDLINEFMTRRWEFDNAKEMRELICL